MLNGERFWQFCLAHYARAGVRSACLQLQDQFQGNVNLALLLIYLEQNRMAVNETQLGQLIQALGPTDALLGPYRRMRRHLKQQLDAAGYGQLLDFELRLERWQQEDLLRLVDTYELMASNTVSPPENLAGYCAMLGAESLVPGLLGA